MAEKKTKLEEAYDKLKEEVLLSEAYIVGVLWNEPELYQLYSQEDLNRKTFLNDVWGFYFGLGWFMQDKGALVFDDITAFKYIEDLKLQKQYEEYGGFETVQEIMTETKGKDDNIDAYFEEVKKYEMLVKLTALFGLKVLEVDGKYDYHKLDSETIQNYWEDKFQAIMMNRRLKFDEADLLDDLEDAIDEMDENPDIGLEFYNMKRLTEAMAGWGEGCLYINGGFGGKGKTSFSFLAIIMSCIVNDEKLLIVANEQSKRDFQKMLLISVIGNETKAFFNRKRLNEGGFTQTEKQKLLDATAWVRSVINSNDSLIKFVFLNDYTMANVKEAVTYFHRRGYNALMIDTGKPSDDGMGMVRWQKFTEDFTQLYKIIKPNGGGLNIKTWVNVQLADSALGMRFLGYGALGDAKKIKNEASCVIMERPLFDDEYAGEKNELECWTWIPREQAEKEDEFNEVPNTPYVRKKIKLNKYYEETDESGKKKTIRNHYYVFFIPKNRRGMDNDTGLDQIVMRVNFNNNTWHEIGWTSVPRDYSH